ncbi:MAG: PIN domain-containing protein, partial [Mycobacteriales bacterium]
MIYLHSSALVKLVFDEVESAALSQWLAERQDVPKISSQIATIELLRTCRRRDEAGVAGARQVLAGLDLLPLAA